MKRIVIIVGVMFIGIVVLLETSGKQKKRGGFMPGTAVEYDEVWWDN